MLDLGFSKLFSGPGRYLNMNKEAGKACQCVPYTDDEKNHEDVLCPHEVSC
jgi:hypothetical protein